MQQFHSLAIGLLAVVSIVPAAGAFTPIADTPASMQPADNLHAQVNINIGIGTQPRPQHQKTIVVETAPRPQPQVIVVERYPSEPARYRGNSSWGQSRGRHEKFHKHGGWHGKKHSKHKHARYDRDDD